MHDTSTRHFGNAVRSSSKHIEETTMSRMSVAGCGAGGCGIGNWTLVGVEVADFEGFRIGFAVCRGSEVWLETWRDISGAKWA